jgi:uncharacterized protein YbjQ (UPF0145 family)
MTNVPFFVVTVDYVPSYLGDLEVTKMATNWGGGSKPQEAIDDLKKYAIKEGYHGIIGLRFDNHTRISGGGLAGIDSDQTYFAYGTMVMLG